MTVPSSMLYFASKLAGYEVTPLQIIPSNATSEDYGPNGQIIFDLPSNTIVSLDSLHIDFLAHCKAQDPSNGVSRLPQDIHKLLRRVSVTAGGQELGYAYDMYDRLKHGVDSLTGREPHPASHPRLVRTGLNPADGPDIVTAAERAKREAVAAAEAAVPTLYDSTTVHIPLKAALDGGAAGITPADGSINIIGRSSSTKLSVCGYDSTGQYKVMSETTFTWTQLAAAIQPDGAQLVPLFELLNFSNYSTTQAMVDAIATAQAAVAAAKAAPTSVDESEGEIEGVRFVWDKFGAFLETVQPRQLDLALLPTITITLHLNTAACLVRATGDDTPQEFIDVFTEAQQTAGHTVSTGFVVSQPRLYIDAIGFSTNAYDAYVSAALQKRAIELPFTNFTHFHSGNYLDDMTFQTSSRSVDRIHFQLSSPVDREVGCRRQVYLAQGYREMTPVDDDPDYLAYAGSGMVDDRFVGEKYAAAQHVSTHNGQGAANYPTPAATFQFNINGTLMPSFPGDCTWWYKASTAAMSEMRDPWKGGVAYPEFASSVCHKVLRLNREGSTVQSASGVNTQNSMLYVSLSSPSGLRPGGSVPAPAMIDVWCETTSLVRVVAARDIEIVP